LGEKQFQATTYIALLFLLIPDYSQIGAAFAFLGYTLMKASISLIGLKASIRREKERISKAQASVPPV